MTDHTEQKIRELKSVRLSESVRLRMREELSSYADLHSYTPVAAGYSPYLSYFPAGFWRVSGALVLFITTLGGTAYAASDTRPGETLYPVKIHLTEPLQTALIPSTSGKAAWHAILAERRLEEATDLAVSGELDTETQEVLTDNFTAHVQESIEAADRLQLEGDMLAAHTVRSDLEARITAHEDILGRVAIHLARDGEPVDSSEAAVQDLLAVVHERQDAAEGARLALESSVDLEETPELFAAKATVALDAAGGQAPETAASLAVADSPADLSRDARSQEIAAIFLKNSALLESLELASTTAASTTATSTIETVPEEEVPEGTQYPRFWRGAE